MVTHLNMMFQYKVIQVQLYVTWIQKKICSSPGWCGAMVGVFSVHCTKRLRVQFSGRHLSVVFDKQETLRFQAGERGGGICFCTSFCILCCKSDKNFISLPPQNLSSCPWPQFSLDSVTWIPPPCPFHYCSDLGVSLSVLVFNSA